MTEQKKFASGGLVPGGYTPPRFERGWWRCINRGGLFEANSNPPLGNEHVCLPKQQEK